MKAYSYDLRLRVLRAVDQGRPRAEIVTLFAISLATLKRYLKRQRETGDVRAKPIPGRPARKGAALFAGLQPQLDAYPDATLAEHCQLWESSQGIKVSTATISRAIQRLDCSITVAHRSKAGSIWRPGQRVHTPCIPGMGSKQSPVLRVRYRHVSLQHSSSDMRSIWRPGNGSDRFVALWGSRSVLIGERVGGDRYAIEGLNALYASLPISQ